MQAAERFAFTRHFRLRGKIAGDERTFALKSGANSIGRAAENDVSLAVKGVSQRHAELTVGPGGLRLEDLQSKNGSFVNGSRVTSAHLRPGDELWIGSAELVLEEVADQERRLAVDISLPLDAGPGELPEDTPTRSRWLDTQVVQRWFTSLARSLDHLGREPDGDLQSLAANLGASTGAAGVSILELDRVAPPGGFGGKSAAEPVVLAVFGELEEGLVAQLTSSFGLLRSTRGADSPRIRFTTTAPLCEPVLTAAMLAEEGQRALVLALSGEFPCRRDVEPLLATHLSLIQRLRARDREASRTAVPRASSRLVLPPGYVAGVAPAMRELHAQMELLAAGDLPVLISGETGAGKEYVARILHASSDRREGAFVAINCAAVPADLLEAELFGIGQGVATGVSARKGRFVQAQGGTLFLDEIGEVPEALQPKLLRVLEAREIHPVGRPPTSIDVRIISATNADLLQRIETGSFRADMYYRLAGVSLSLPPLRERREDVPMLVEQYLRQISGEIGKRIRGITVGAMQRLIDYRWPGNVRELVHEVRRLIYVCPEGEAIETALLAEHIRRQGSGPPGAEDRDPASGGSLEEWFRQTDALDLQTIECVALMEALRRTEGNQVQAGRLLGISRMAVRRRIERCQG